MASSFMPQMIRSLSIASNVPPKLQNSANARSSATNVAIDSPGLLLRLLKRKRSTISDGAGLKCLDSVSTRLAYDLSPGLSGESRFRRVLYVDGPISERNTALFFSAPSMPFATKKCVPRIAASRLYCRRNLRLGPVYLTSHPRRQICRDLSTRRASKSHQSNQVQLKSQHARTAKMRIQQ